MKEESKRDYIKEPLTDEEFVVMGRRMGMNETNAKQILLNSMKEESKYYTPTIEEFHVGFGYEWLNDDNEWVKEDTPIEITVEGYEEQAYGLRVKALDREDIESLGWERTIADKVYRKGRFLLYYHEDGDDGCVLISENKTNSILKGERLFFGTIKNKSELKRILNQLEISEQ